MKKRYWGTTLTVILLFLISLALWFIGWLILQDAPTDKPSPPVTEPATSPQRQQTTPAIQQAPQAPQTPEPSPPLPEDSRPEGRPITLPDLRRNAATMSDEEKQAAIEQVAQDAATAAIASGQGEIIANEAAREARQYARRIFYPQSMAD